MARAQSSDFLHSMRFHVSVTKAGDGGPLIRTGSVGDVPEAGFNQVTTPEVTVEAVEYKEGHYIYTRKYPGNPSMGDITMSRGVTRTDSSFWAWIQTVIEGEGEYRADIDIKHYGRESLRRDQGNATNATTNQTTVAMATPARVYHVKEAFPIRHKVAADLDGTASEVSIMELDCSYEYFEVENN